MSKGVFQFDRFILDAADRRLLRDEVAVDINTRYLDALTLLVREHGRLVTKQRFLDEVWQGVPVTEEALTQCIRSLRRVLGDDAARPRFIETVPKHGYRFISPVTEAERTDALPRHAPLARTVDAGDGNGAPHLAPEFLFRTGRAGMIGGGAAGLLGGLLYGFSGILDTASGGGAVSGILVMAALTMIIGLVGGAGVGFGVGASAFASGRTALWTVAGGAAGGMAVGGVVKLLGADAFSFLFGRSPGEITGAPEGAVLGAAIGAGLWAARRLPVRAAWTAAGLLGAVAGTAISLAGGRLLGGSLDLLAAQFPGSHLRMDDLGRWMGEPGFGPVIAAISAGLEGFLFCSFVVAAIVLERQRQAGDRPAKV